jgi:phosphonopyruvate decarboxylase
MMRYPTARPITPGKAGGRGARLSAAAEFYSALKGAGVDFVAGVPCSSLGPLFCLAARDREVVYVPAVREDVAVAAAAGGALAGKRALVLMQNSALGVCGNALLSLTALYRLPLLVVIGWRGCDPAEAPEHRAFGPPTRALCRHLGLTAYALPKRFSRAGVLRFIRRCQAGQALPAVLVKPGVLS